MKNTTIKIISAALRVRLIKRVIEQGEVTQGVLANKRLCRGT